MRTITTVILALASVYPLLSSTHAADISWQEATASGDPPIITISGVISPHDDQTFHGLAAGSSEAIVALDSGGGSVAAALEIGRAIRLKGFATAVLPETLCASACALICLAGTPRLSSTSSS